MKTYKHKICGLLILLAFSAQAQKFDKTIKERFKVNPNATIVINTTHTDVDIETWNKNEVVIEAVMEVEGVDKKEADRILKKWKFEALGNKDKVKITSLSNPFHFDFLEDLELNFDLHDMEIEIPEFELELHDIELHELEFELPKIEFSEFEFPELEMEVFEFDYQKYKNDSTYMKRYKAKIAPQIKKFKKGKWSIKIDSIKDSKEFKEKMEAYKKAVKKAKIDVEKLKNSEEYKKQIEESKKIAEKVRKEMKENKELIQKQVEMAKKASKLAREEWKKNSEEWKKMAREGKLKHGENYYFNFSDKDSKVKVKKYLKIKVPKKATFDLNVRHGKLNVPNSNTKMSANISYGNFIAGIIDGSKNELKFSNSPVFINSMNSGTITLKNVPNARFGTFSDINLFANSSDVHIKEIGSDVALSQKFGKLEVENIVTDFNNLNLILDYAKAHVNFSNSEYTYKISNKNSTFHFSDTMKEEQNRNIDGVLFIEGFLKNKNSLNNLLITGVYSTIVMN